MAKTQYERQKESDAKNGYKMRGYRLPLAVIAEIARLAEVSGKSQAAVIEESVRLWAQRHKKSRFTRRLRVV